MRFGLDDDQVAAARVAEALRLGGRFFPVPILGIDPAAAFLVASLAMTARMGFNGHTLQSTREAAEALAWEELGPTPLARELMDDAMSRVREYMTGG